MNQDDKKKILQELGGISEAVYDEMVQEFLTELQEQLVELKTLLNQNEFPAVKQIAHAIRGAASNFRIYSIAEAAAALEGAAKKGQDKGEVQKKLAELEKVGQASA